MLQWPMNVPFLDLRVQHKPLMAELGDVFSRVVSL